MICNILIAGVGGQGTVLASKLLAAAAIDAGLDVRTTETIGMAQRGGSVVGHTRIGDGIYSPLIQKRQADVLIAFEPSEGARQLPYLSPGGTIIVCDSGVSPVTNALISRDYEPGQMLDYIKKNAKRAIIINGAPILSKHAKMLNVALLGATAASGVLPFDFEKLKTTISNMPKLREQNLEAFELGRKAVCETF